MVSTLALVWAAGTEARAADAPKGAEAAVVQELVVTARQREEKLTDTPVAVSAFTGVDLENKRITNVSDVISRVPNLFVQKGNTADQSNILIRGVGLNTPLEPSVAVFVDGVYMPSDSWHVGFLDLARVEVLRGPQGALFGRNTEAGVINLVSKEPKSDYSGELKADYDSFNTLTANFFVTGPITDKVLFSLAGQDRHTDGYIRNVANGTWATAHSDETLKGALKFPGDRLTVTLRADWAAGRGGVENQVGRVVGSPSALNQPGKWEETQDFDDWEEREDYGASANATYDFDAMTLTSITGWRHQWSLTQREPNGTVARNLGGGPTPNILNKSDFPTPVGFGQLWLYNFDQDVLSQEVRLSSRGEGRLRWIAGVYGYRDRNVNNFDRRLPNAMPGLVFAGNFVHNDSTITSNGYSVFGQVSYDILPKLEGTVALRYTYEHLDEFAHLSFNIANFLKDNFTQRPSTSFDRVVPQGSLKYRWSDDFMTYLNIGQGYKGGGLPRTIPAQSIANVAFQSEIATNYEFGSKATLLDGKLVTSLALYYIDITNAQVNQLISIAGVNVPVTGNAAKEKSQGVEFEFTARPTASLTLNGSVGYIDAKYVSYHPNSGQNLSGTFLPNVPDWTSSFGATYTHPLRDDVTLRLSADYNYVGRIIRGTGTGGDPIVSIKPYDTVNAAAGLDFKNWSLTLYVDNLFDAYNIYTARPGSTGLLEDVAIATAFQRPAGPPRNVGIRANYRF